MRKKQFTKFATSPNNLKQISHMDNKGRYLTHFYQNDINHRGIGKVSYYNSQNRAVVDFKPYKKEKKVKIYVVSRKSKIETFPKISYDKFFQKLDNNIYNQNQLRTDIKKKVMRLPYVLKHKKR